MATEKNLRHLFFILFFIALLPFNCSNVRKIHDEVLTVDTHCDTPMRLVEGNFDIGKRHETGKRGSGKIDLPRMKDGGLDAQFFAVFIGQGKRTPEAHLRVKARADSIIDSIEKMCRDYPQLIELATTPDDAYRIEKLGKIAAYIGMENGYPIGKNLSLVKIPYIVSHKK